MQAVSMPSMYALLFLCRFVTFATTGEAGKVVKGAHLVRCMGFNQGSGHVSPSMVLGLEGKGLMPLVW